MEVHQRHVSLILATWLFLGIICMKFGLVWAEWQGNLTTYHIASFSYLDPDGNPNAKLNHFTLSGPDGDVYVGSVNYLFKLSSSLNQLQNVSTCISADNRCDRDTNYNKILILYDDEGLLTCGSENRGKCQLRDTSDITHVLKESEIRDDVTYNVAGYGELSTVGLIAPGPDGKYLYIAVSNADVDDYRKAPAISRQTLESTPFVSSDFADRITFGLSYVPTILHINYVFAFSTGGFTYFVSSQKEDVAVNTFVSKINRVCHNHDSLDAYTEITIQCSGSDGSLYSLVQAADFGPAGPDLAASLGLDADEMVLYAVFAKNQGAEPTEQSALCVYRMTHILDAFREAVRGCMQDGVERDDTSGIHSVEYLNGHFCNNLPVVSINKSMTSKQSGDVFRMWMCHIVSYLDGSICNTFQPSPDNFLCNPDTNGGDLELYQYAKGITPVESTALLELPGTLMSLIITTIEVNHTIALIGTSTGDLLKVHIESATSARVYEKVPLDTNPVQTDVQIDHATRVMHVLTEQKLIKMRVENCGQYTTCETCIGIDAGNDGDPYCGWCTLGRRCTRYSDCPSPDVSTRWLAYNAAQCIEITSVIPYNSLPITVTEQQRSLTVQQLPDLPNGQSYDCYFGSYVSPATKTGDVLECTSPPSDMIPPIQQGNDAVTVQLGVYSTETSVEFIDTEFHFYECATHTSCVACVDSRWACDWCVFENRCTHNSSTCTGSNEIIITGDNNPVTSSSKGPGFCPQLQNQTDEVVIPNETERTIMVWTLNLPDPAQISSYLCVLNVEGKRQTVNAERMELTTDTAIITCGEKDYFYSADVPELIVILTIEWTDSNGGVHILDDIGGFDVTLYKCAVEKPDCSRCVTARQELDCVWCGSECKLNGTCSNRGLHVTRMNDNCPNPDLEEVFPLTGPIEGNTVLAVMGTNIGRRFEDITEVMVGDQPCDLDGLDAEYKTGTSVSCRTRSKSEGTELVSLTVRGADNTSQPSSGSVNFEYTDPKIDQFQPRQGPQAGGTAVSVTGTALNAGRNIEAFIGDIPCIVTSQRTETMVVCITSSGEVGEAGVVTLSFDGASRTSSQTYTYTINPIILKVSPLTSINSGGRVLNVEGKYLDISQKRQIVVSVGTRDAVRQVLEDCEGESAEMMQCPSPNISTMSMTASTSNVTFGFIMDEVTALRSWSTDNGVELEYFQDPEYTEFEDGLMEQDGNKLTIRGKRIDSAINAQEIQVRIGTGSCDVSFIDEVSLICTLPDERPANGDFLGNDTERGLPVVWVIHNNLRLRIGYIVYEPPNPVPIAVGAASGAVLVCILFLVLCFISQVYGAKREAKLIQEDMHALEQALADEVRQAFAELQTDLTDLTSDLEGIGMPFVSHREYATNMLFIGQESTPSTEDEEYPNEQVERAMVKFSQLLSNKNFLLLFIQTLDAESSSKLSIREKQSIASLLTVVMVLENKLVYMTDIMITLMTQMIENAADNNRTRQLFCRTESILEKLMSNWVALCLYDQLKNHTAYPLFVLYRAIKYRSESGPIDVMTGRSRFSLNYDKLLQEDVEFNSLTLVVLIDEDGSIIKEVKVLDVDTISQVKEKILDAVYRNSPYSRRPSANQVNLEWRHGKSGKLVLTDTNLQPLTDKWRRINMLKDFQVTDRAHVTLVEKDVINDGELTHANLKLEEEGTSHVNTAFDAEKMEHRLISKKCYTVAEVEAQEGIRDWHLTQEEEWPSEEDDDGPRRRRGCISLKTITFRNKISRRKIKEISFPRLLSTKGIVQEYVHNMFQAILSVESAPKAIKYLFDFFDSQAVRHDLTSNDPDLVHIWKSNILPLRFWANAIKHPDYIFDIRPSLTVEASLDVIGQLFHDAHDTKTHKLGQETSINKLLYSSEKGKYHKFVDSFYEEVEELPPVSKQDLNKELYKACENFTGLFSKLSTLDQLWKLVRRFKKQLLEAIEDNERCQEESLDGLLKEVENILSGEPEDAV